MAGLVRKTFVTCADTGRTYDLENPHPHIYRVHVEVDSIDENGNAFRSGFCCMPLLGENFFVEEETLQELGLVSKPRQDRCESKPESVDREETVEELLLELLRKLREKEGECE